jgi:hypothetical protein
VWIPIRTRTSTPLGHSSEARLRSASPKPPARGLRQPKRGAKLGLPDGRTPCLRTAARESFLRGFRLE